jgi:hypothetical protein
MRALALCNARTSREAGDGIAGRVQRLQVGAAFDLDTDSGAAGDRHAGNVHRSRLRRDQPARKLVVPIGLKLRLSVRNTPATLELLIELVAPSVIVLEVGTLNRPTP